MLFFRHPSSCNVDWRDGSGLPFFFLHCASRSACLGFAVSCRNPNQSEAGTEVPAVHHSCVPCWGLQLCLGQINQELPVGRCVWCCCLLRICVGPGHAHCCHGNVALGFLQIFTARLLPVPLGCPAGALSLGRFWKHICIQHLTEFKNAGGK